MEKKLMVKVSRNGPQNGRMCYKKNKYYLEMLESKADKF